MARVFLAFGFYCIAFSLFSLTRHVGITMASSDSSNASQSATKIGDDLKNLFDGVTKYVDIKTKYKSSEFKVKERNGSEIAKEMKNDLESTLKNKIQSVMTLAEKAEEIKNNYTYEKDISFQFFDSKDLGNMSLVKEQSFADIPVNLTYSTVHVPTDVYKGSEGILNSAKWTREMNKYFIENRKQEPSLLWQLLGTSTGVYRVYPGYKWPKDDAQDFFDHRRRGWYIQGSSSPKDMVILLDLSGSMVGTKLAIVKLAADILLDTLQENDFVNIITVNKGARMVCEEKNVKKALPEKTKHCVNNILLQATIQNKKYLKELVRHVTASNVSEVQLGFKKAIDILKAAKKSNNSSSNCIQTINFFTDGVEETGRKKTIEVLKQYNAKKEIRVFGYLVGREKGSPYKPVQQFACENKGYFYTIETLSDVRERVTNYLNVLSRPLALQRTSNPNENIPTWTPIYFDQLGLGLMITVVAPIYDSKHKDKLLGVVGTDVAIPSLRDSVPGGKIGVNSYGFAINNNGFILFHPRLKEEEDPPNLVLADVNLEAYKKDLKELSRKLIDRETGEMKFKLRRISKDLKRISPERMYFFYYTDISKTSFSSAVAFSKVGKFKLEPKSDQEIDRKLFNATKAGETIMIAPWRICDKIVAKARKTTPLYKPTYADAADFVANLTSSDQCNKELLDILLYDANAIKTIKWNIDVNDTRGYLAAFVGTSGGFTRVFAPGQENPVNRDVTREPFYQRSADFQTDDVVVSAPYKEPGSNKDDDNVITASSPILVNNSALAAVVGMQMKDDVLKEIITNNSITCKENENWSCYLIDEDGYIVASSTNSSKIEVGKHFGAVHGQVMQKLIDQKLFDLFYFNDTQSKCEKGFGQPSSAMRLINPFLAVSNYVTWMTQTLFWSLVQLNIFSFFSRKSKVVAEESVSSKEFCTYKIPFFKANKTIRLYKEGYKADGDCSGSDKCFPYFEIHPVQKSNLFLVTVKKCDECSEKPITTTPVRVPSILFTAPANRYRRLPQLKCYANSTNETDDCGSGANLSPMKLLITLLITACLVLVH